MTNYRRKCLDCRGTGTDEDRIDSECRGCRGLGYIVEDVDEEHLSIADVTRWLVYHGITHIVACERFGWTHTLCESLISYEGQNKKPHRARICRKCRERLATARKVDPKPQE